MTQWLSVSDSLDLIFFSRGIFISMLKMVGFQLLELLCLMALV